MGQLNTRRVHIFAESAATKLHCLATTVCLALLIPTKVSQFQTLDNRSAIISEVFGGFSQALQRTPANVFKLDHCSYLLHPSNFIIHPVILIFYAIGKDLLKAPIKAEVKQSRYRPGVAQRVPGS